MAPCWQFIEELRGFHASLGKCGLTPGFSSQPKPCKTAWFQNLSQSISLTSTLGWQKVGTWTTIHPPLPMVGITNQSRVYSPQSKVNAPESYGHSLQLSNHSAVAPEVRSSCQSPSMPIEHILGFWEIPSILTSISSPLM